MQLSHIEIISIMESLNDSQTKLLYLTTFPIYSKLYKTDTPLIFKGYIVRITELLQNIFLVKKFIISTNF